MFIKITRATFLSGHPAEVGEIFEVDEQTAKQSVATNKAIIVDAPSDTVIDPPKPKVKKVSEKPKGAAKKASEKPEDDTKA